MYVLRNNNEFNREEIDYIQLTVIVRVTEAIADADEAGFGYVAFRVASFHECTVGKRPCRGVIMAFPKIIRHILNVAVFLRLWW